MTSRANKEVVIVAGANGSGKELSPEDPAKARIAAGRKVISLIDELVTRGKSFVIESTLSGSFLEKYVQKLKELSPE